MSFIDAYSSDAIKTPMCCTNKGCAIVICSQSYFWTIPTIENVNGVCQHILRATSITFLISSDNSRTMPVDGIAIGVVKIHNTYYHKSESIQNIDTPIIDIMSWGQYLSSI